MTKQFLGVFGMFKKLLLTVALLAPGLAYGQVSAPLTLSVVASGVPANAQVAGFTTNVVKADFTSGGTVTIGGTTMSNTPTSGYIVNCGASDSVSNNLSSWRFYYIANYTSTTFGCPGTTTQTGPVITTDSGGGGNQALALIETVADYNSLIPGSCTNNCNPNGAALLFPAKLSEGTATSWLPQEFYMSVTFRMDHNSIFNQPNPGGSHQLFGEPFAGSAVVLFGNSWVDYDLEGASVFISECGASSQIRGQMQEGNSIGQTGAFSTPVVCYITDLTVYHKYEALFTSDEATSIDYCGWLDGTFLGCTSHPYALQLNSGFAYSRRDRSMQVGLSIINPPNLQATNDLIDYITNIEIWACPNVATSNCKGTTFTPATGSTPSHWN